MGAEISIIIPTQRRPGPLALAARSTFRQTGVDFAAVELVVVDNDATPSARETVNALAAEAPFAVRYVHEPRAGVAYARNAAMAAAFGDTVAFLDDDEEAPDGWLGALLAARSRLDADVVFGPVRARAPDTVVRHRRYFERFFSRFGPDDERVLDNYFGCGNSLVRRAALPDWTTPFSLERNYIGGEDDMLFGRMQARGAVFGWAADAFVWEDPAPGRLTLRYTLARAFAYGQGPSAHCASSTPPNYPGVAKWMAVGLVQGVVFGVIALFKWLVSAPDRAEALDRAARGLGKTFWGGPFKIAFYGLPARTAS
jgi:glycosyltransferase involved in cell wall biosynthesis